MTEYKQLCERMLKFLRDGLVSIGGSSGIQRSLVDESVLEAWERGFAIAAESEATTEAQRAQRADVIDAMATRLRSIVGAMWSERYCREIATELAAASPAVARAVIAQAEEHVPPPLPPLQPHHRECTCVGACKGAEGLAPGWVCAMSKKAPNRCQARKSRHPKHIDDVCEGDCCTTCGGPIDDNSECRCG